jgi:hypothetical protein
MASLKSERELFVVRGRIAANTVVLHNDGKFYRPSPRARIFFTLEDATAELVREALTNTCGLYEDLQVYQTTVVEISSWAQSPHESTTIEYIEGGPIKPRKIDIDMEQWDPLRCPVYE